MVLTYSYLNVLTLFSCISHRLELMCKGMAGPSSQCSYSVCQGHLQTKQLQTSQANCGKMKEWFYLKTMSRHLKEKRVTGNSQHRFAMGKLWPTNLKTCSGEMIVWLEEGKAAGVAYLDLSNIFDTVIYSILEAKLLRYKKLGGIQIG